MEHDKEEPTHSGGLAIQLSEGKAVRGRLDVGLSGSLRLHDKLIGAASFHLLPLSNQQMQVGSFLIGQINNIHLLVCRDRQMCKVACSGYRTISSSR